MCQLFLREWQGQRCPWWHCGQLPRSWVLPGHTGEGWAGEYSELTHWAVFCPTVPTALVWSARHSERLVWASTCCRICLHICHHVRQGPFQGRWTTGHFLVDSALSAQLDSKNREGCIGQQMYDVLNLLDFFHSLICYFMYKGVMPVCMSVYYMCAVPKESRKGHQIPMWVLGIETGLERSKCSQPCTISSVPYLFICVGGAHTCLNVCVEIRGQLADWGMRLRLSVLGAGRHLYRLSCLIGLCCRVFQKKWKSECWGDSWVLKNRWN